MVFCHLTLCRKFCPSVASSGLQNFVQVDAEGFWRKCVDYTARFHFRSYDWLKLIANCKLCP